jgi:DNA-binding transcriptional LysR family regulator
MMNQIDLSRVNLNLLVLFEVVSQELHVGRAAGRLNLSASAVSHGLGRLRILFKDPLFVRTPKGVVPTERAIALAEPVAEILARVRAVVGAAEPFDAATSRRRFVVGAPDALLAVLLPRFLASIRDAAPNIDIGSRALLPASPAWFNACEDLDKRKMDLALLPFSEPGADRVVPARFVARPLYDEVLVVAMRRGHSFAKAPTLKRYCALHHVMVASSDEGRSRIDDVLAAQGTSRRVALTVPNFMMSLTTAAATDLLATLPSKFVAAYGEALKVTSAPLPLKMPNFQVWCIAPKAALTDAGLAWLFNRIMNLADVSD